MNPNVDGSHDICAGDDIGVVVVSIDVVVSTSTGVVVSTGFSHSTTFLTILLFVSQKTT